MRMILTILPTTSTKCWGQVGIFGPHLLQLPTEPTGGACLTHDVIREGQASAQGATSLADPDLPVPGPLEGVG